MAQELFKYFTCFAAFSPLINSVRDSSPFLLQADETAYREDEELAPSHTGGVLVSHDCTLD